MIEETIEKGKGSWVQKKKMIDWQKKKQGNNFRMSTQIVKENKKENRKVRFSEEPV